MSFNVQRVISLCLVIFVLYWLFVAASAKPTQESKGWIARNSYAILWLAGTLLIANFKPLARLGLRMDLLATRLLPHSLALDILSAVLAAAGLLIAVAARQALGGNWSSAVARNVGHELVTTGLYRYVRHPIYAGVLLLAVGSALSFGTVGACLGFLVFVLGVRMKLRDEEQLLSQHFPQDYTAYRKHTKVLIPFIW